MLFCSCEFVYVFILWIIDTRCSNTTVSNRTDSTTNFIILVAACVGRLKWRILGYSGFQSNCSTVSGRFKKLGSLVGCKVVYCAQQKFKVVRLYNRGSSQVEWKHRRQRMNFTLVVPPCNIKMPSFHRTNHRHENKWLKGMNLLKLITFTKKIS